MAVRDPMSKFLAAEKVWNAVAAAGENGISGQEVMDQTGLTRSQFENGKAHIRDCVAKDMGQSFLYDGDVYVATTEPGRCALGLVIRLSAVDAQLKRTFESICAPLGDAADSHPTVKYLRDQLVAMRGNLDMARELGFLPNSPKLRANSGRAK
ncbi:MAG TPA: hypothetical protein VHX38_04995 [Pseudonocardiaceae bacterium]|jgi:hypothetical protein|nr:hypothetical protein [Pseudonocardiaceae bacterium]